MSQTEERMDDTAFETYDRDAWSALERLKAGEYVPGEQVYDILTMFHEARRARAAEATLTTETAHLRTALGWLIERFDFCEKRMPDPQADVNLGYWSTDEDGKEAFFSTARFSAGARVELRKLAKGEGDAE